MNHSPFRWALLALLTLVAANSALADSAQGRSYALLISVNDYAHLRDLYFADNDMRALRGAFLKTGFEPNNVMLLHGGASRTGQLPFRNNIIHHLQVFLGSVRENDTIVVAFSGHGVNVNGKDYFCSADAKLENPGGTMVPIALVDHMLRASRARQKVLIMDACRNDPFKTTKSVGRVGAFGSKGLAGHVKSASRDGSFEARGPASRGYVVMRSCEAQQESVEDPQLGHGVFMNFVIQGLLGRADTNRDRRVNLLELHQYAEAETRNHVRLRHDMLQTPTLELPDGELVGSYVLAHLPAPKPKPSTMPRRSSDPSRLETQLYESAYSLFQRGKVEQSIVAFEQLLRVVEHERVRDVAKMKLVAAYLTADPVNNISKAVRVQPQEGVTVAVLRDSKLMSGKEQRGTVKAGQMVRITKVSGGWHRVAAINGRVLRDGKVGFIYKTALTPPPKSSKPPKSDRPSDSGAGKAKVVPTPRPKGPNWGNGGVKPFRQRQHHGGWHRPLHRGHGWGGGGRWR